MKPLLWLGVLGFLVGVGLCVAGLSQGGLCLVSAVLVVLGEVLPARRDEKELTELRRQFSDQEALFLGLRDRLDEYGEASDLKQAKAELALLKTAFLTLEQRQKAVLDRNGF